MSIRAMQAVWDSGKGEGRMLLLLLALADYADNDGVCWPSYDTLAEKIRCSRSTVIRLIGEAWRAGYLVKLPGGGRGHSNRYIIALKGVTRDTVRKGVRTDVKGVISDVKGVTRDTRTVSTEPSIEPSERARGKVTVAEALRKAREEIDPGILH